MPDLIAAMEGALTAFSADQVLQPVRTVLEVGPDRAFFGVMPAALDDPPVVGAKLVTVYEGNHDRGLPSHLATIVLLDHATGALVALVDGRYITEARTAAVSAVSAKHLARPNAAILGIVGSGVQARSHLEALQHVRPLSDVRVWSPTTAHCEAFAVEMRATTDFPVRAVPSAGDAVADADLVVLATGSREAVVADAEIAAGTHIMAVGACRPDQREMTTALIARSRLVVDSRVAAFEESGDVMMPIAEGAIDRAHIVAELGEIAAGTATARQSDDDVTIFKSLGMAVEDVVAARLALERATAERRGQLIDLT